jgi:hypothetical protein
MTGHGFGATPIWGANTSMRCRHCQRPYFAEQADPCLGRLENVVHACCGHGRAEEATVTVVDGEWSYGRDPSGWSDLDKRTLTGEEALAFFAERGCGPPPKPTSPHGPQPPP